MTLEQILGVITTGANNMDFMPLLEQRDMVTTEWRFPAEQMSSLPLEVEEKVNQAGWPSFSATHAAMRLKYPKRLNIGRIARHRAGAHYTGLHKWHKCFFSVFQKPY